MAPRPLEAGDPERIGEYRVIARLGSGGQGVVYLGTAPDGLRVAIKRLHPWFGGTARGRQLFAREIKSADRVKGYTARVLDSGEQAGRPYVVSEYIPGESVLDRVRREGPYGPAEALALASGTASALAAIHEAGLVHCDFKPANVLTGPDGARVVDFGIARALDTIAHRDNELRGTPAYMAPEQVTGGAMGPHTDVFAWGSTMAFAATGKPPFGFSEEYGHGVMYRIAHQEPDLDAVPEPLRGIIARCLAKDPAERPSAADVVAVLGRDAAPGAPSAGAQVGDSLTGHTGAVICIGGGSLGGEPVAVTGSDDRTARVWDLTACEQRGAPLRHDDAVLSVACGVLDGAPIAVTGCQDRTLGVWDLATGERIGEPLRGHTGAVLSVAVAVLDGGPVAVSAGDDRTVRLWDLAGHRQLGPPLVGNNSVMSVACGDLDGRAVAVIGGAWDQSLRVLDLADRRPAGLPLTGHTNSVMAVAWGSLAGRPIAVTGGYDRTVRVWDLRTRREVGRPLVHRSAVMSVAFGTRGDEPIAVTGGADRAVRVWSLLTREQAGDPLLTERTLTGPAVPVACAELGGRPIAITGGEDRALRLWNLGTGPSSPAATRDDEQPAGR
ncbi:serine/threonine-protein kinase [Actinomadura chokoriensis]|uniref:WD40 repeat domain-containing serine/threonine protein kinase n=1 Tax=Actinomadura chokoriensis TaxID=454156 RepID=UPI0031F865BC